MNKNKLLTKYSFRASRANTILALSDDLSIKDVKIAKKIALNNEIISNNYKVLALANELSMYYASKKKLDIETYKKTTHNISLNLSKTKKEKLKRAKEQISILNTNYQSRLSYGFLHQGQNYLHLSLRPAMHDIFENNYAFTKGNTIEFFKSSFKINHNSLKIDEFSLLSITSLSDFNMLFYPLSYSFSLDYGDILSQNKINLKLKLGLAKISNNYLFAYLLGTKAFKNNLSFDNSFIFSYFKNTNTFSLLYERNFYKNKMQDDDIYIKFQRQIARNFDIFLGYKISKYQKNRFLSSFRFYF